MAADVLIDLDDESLLNRLQESREELFNLRFQNATGQLTNTARIKQVKREIARCLTEARAREITAAEAMSIAGDAVGEDTDAEDGENR
ncbi:MAG: 50S ribosomal protein L29 [Acidimicrobiales bacterium]|nr:50S ribosomal protein L29 [Acidimicrobiales bacterium]